MDTTLDNILKKKDRHSNRKKIPENFFQSNSLPDVIKVYYQKKINIKQIDMVIKTKLKKLNQETKLKKYIKESEKFLNFYNSDSSLALELLEQYLDISSKYIRIERIKKLENINLCKGCNKQLDSVTEEKEGFLVCSSCNCINSYLTPNRYIKDNEKNINFFDEETNNFLKALDKFEGKTSLILSKFFLSKLDEYFDNINFFSGEYIRNLPKNNFGKKDNTSKKMLWVALERLGYSNYYDEVNYIANIYWGWALPNLDSYKEKILKDYRNTQNVWNIIKGDYRRSASLGTQYRLYVQLMACGYPNCFKEDFKLQENVESLRLHNDAWKRMCDLSNIEYHCVSF